MEAVVSGGFIGGPLMARQCGTDAEADKALEVIGLWRERLSDISW